MTAAAGSVPAPFADALAGKGTLILGGVVGSTAYGMATSASDLDRLGVYVAPTAQYLGVRPPKPNEDSVVVRDPSDVTMHEVGKTVRMLLSASPIMTDLLWLPDELYEYVDPIGAELRSMRSAFLSADKVRGAYLGFADEALGVAIKRAEAAAEPDPRARKGARHALRMLHQGVTAPPAKAGGFAQAARGLG